MEYNVPQHNVDLTEKDFIGKCLWFRECVVRIITKLSTTYEKEESEHSRI
jgi:hypothetical protein